jgi:hypothetical protein
MSDLLKDFDVLSPPKRIARIGGEDIDVTIVPARAALKFISFSKKYHVDSVDSMSPGGFDPGMIDSILEVIELICRRSSEKITKEWLLDNVDIKVLMEFIQYVFAGMKDMSTGEPAGDTEKNLESGT